MTMLLDRLASGGMADGEWQRATAMTTVGSPPAFFPSSNRYLRFPSNLQNCCMEIVWVFFFFFVSVGGSSKLFGLWRIENLYFVECQFDFLVHGCASFCFQRL